MWQCAAKDGLILILNSLTSYCFPSVSGGNWNWYLNNMVGSFVGRSWWCHDDDGELVVDFLCYGLPREISEKMEPPKNFELQQSIVTWLSRSTTFRCCCDEWTHTATNKLRLVTLCLSTHFHRSWLLIKVLDQIQRLIHTSVANYRSSTAQLKHSLTDG